MGVIGDHGLFIDEAHGSIEVFIDMDLVGSSTGMILQVKVARVVKVVLEVCPVPSQIILSPASDQTA